jgi:hypothetical protein
MSAYLLRRRRSEPEARGDIAKSRAIETEHERLNREWSEHIRYSRTPEGMAERAKWKAFLEMGRELVRSGETGAMVYPAEGEP